MQIHDRIHDDMSSTDPSVVQLLLESQREIRDDLKELRRESNHNLSEAVGDIREDISELRSELSDIKDDTSELKEASIEFKAHQTSQNERLTRLEQQVIKSNKHAQQRESDSSSPPAKKAVMSKENAITAGAGIGGAGILYAVLEIIKTYLASK